jgi:hypothetical protein
VSLDELLIAVQAAEPAADWVKYYRANTSSGWKLHVYAETTADVVEIARRLVPVAETREVDIKLATGRQLKDPDPLQRVKGAVAYLPRRQTASADREAVVAAFAGYRHSSHGVPGERFAGNGVSERFELLYDPGRDVSLAEYRRLYRPAQWTTDAGPEIPDR